MILVELYVCQPSWHQDCVCIHICICICIWAACVWLIWTILTPRLLSAGKEKPPVALPSTLHASICSSSSKEDGDEDGRLRCSHFYPSQLIRQPPAASHDGNQKCSHWWEWWEPLRVGQGRCVVPPISLLTVWQYRDARQQLPFRFPLQIEVQSSAMGRFWPGDDGSIGPHLEMMTGGEASQRANKLRWLQ